MSSFLRELKRRKVYGTAVAYLAIAWGVLQVAEFFLGDIIEAPAWVLQTLLLCAVMGFPLALILSWLFDLNRSGVRRTIAANGDLQHFEGTEQEQLATMMATDLAAYEPKLARDTDRAVRLAQQATELIRRHVDQTGGVLKQVHGDKSLSLFEQPAQALLCALEIQLAARELEDFELRIGLSQGEVALSEGQVYGSEVGLAERMPKLAEPGGVALSGRVRQSLPHRLPLALFRSLEQPADSPTAGIRAYRLTAEAFDPALVKRERAAQTSPPDLWKPVAATLILLAFALLIWLFQPQWPGAVSEEPISSVGVIPFVNLSEEPANEIFVDGLTEELIFKLSRIPDLQVPSRTLSFALKDLALDHGEIAERMNVGAFIEGTARFGRDAIKITVQLIDTGSGFHLWAGEYLAKLDDDHDILQLHNTIALDVVDSLQLALSANQRQALEQLPTDNLQAWNAYTEGVGQLDGPRSALALQRAEAAFRRALELDPEYARAHAGLCRVMVERYHISQDPAHIPFARNSCDRARQIDAALLEVDLAYGWLYRVTGDSGAGLKAFQRVLGLEPDNVEALVGAGWLHYSEGREAEADEHFEHALSLSPSDPLALKYVAIFHFFEGRLERAAELFGRAVEVQPMDPYAWSNLGAAHLRRGDDDAARRAFQHSLEVEPTFTAYHNLGDINYRLGDYRYAASLYREALALSPDDLDARADLAATLYQLAPDGEDTQLAFRRLITKAEELLEQRPRYGKAYYLRAYALGHLGDAAAAERDLDEALRIDPNDGTMHYYGAVIRTLEGSPTAAFFHIKQALENGYPKSLLADDPTLAHWRDSEMWTSLLGDG